jgi:hypothetical protein
MSTQKNIHQLSLPEKARLNRYLLEKGYVLLAWDNDDKQKSLEDAFIELKVVPVDQLNKEETSEAMKQLRTSLAEKGATITIGETTDEKIMQSVLNIHIKFFERTGSSDLLRKKVNYYKLFADLYKTNQKQK